MEKLFKSREEIFDSLFIRYPVLEGCKSSIYKAFELLKETVLRQNILYLAGNGGSAADSEHIVGELMKSFMAKRPIDEKLADKLKALYGEEGDVFWGISTSGNSKNIVKAAMLAKAKGLKVMALVGQKECRLDALCDVIIHVPETETYKVQELHLPVYHALCAMLESEFYGK